jgi:hypothetical protein
MAGIDEALLEYEFLGWLRAEAYEVLHGPTIARRRAGALR